MELTVDFCSTMCILLSSLDNGCRIQHLLRLDDVVSTTADVDQSPAASEKVLSLVLK